MIVLLDTSIMLPLLGFPGEAGKREGVLAELNRLGRLRADRVVPFVVLLETGNHVVKKIKNGEQRRRMAMKFVGLATQILEGAYPWKPVHLPEPAEFATWLHGFPDSAQRGASLADHTILSVWNDLRRQWPDRRVRIYALDQHLAGYDTDPS